MTSPCPPQSDAQRAIESAMDLALRIERERQEQEDRERLEKFLQARLEKQLIAA